MESKLEKKNVNYFVRSLISIVALAVSVMAFLSFFLAEPKYQITTGIITLIAIVVVLVLSESFNNLSIGKVLTLSNEVKKKESEKETVKDENKVLRQELFKIVANVQQSQVNNTYNAPSDEWLKALGVVKSDDDDEENDEDEICDNNSVSDESKLKAPSSAINNNDYERNRRKLRRYAIDAALNKYASRHPALETEFVGRVEFSSAFHAIDPIMDRRIVFDGYLKNGDDEIFVEVRHKEMNSLMFLDRLYLMLSKINLYREAKNSNAELLLLIIETPFFESDGRNKVDRLVEYFQPAIKNGLLRIEYMKITEEEAVAASNGHQPQLF